MVAWHRQLNLDKPANTSIRKLGSCPFHYPPRVHSAHRRYIDVAGSFPRGNFARQQFSYQGTSPETEHGFLVIVPKHLSSSSPRLIESPTYGPASIPQKGGPGCKHTVLPPRRLVWGVLLDASSSVGSHRRGRLGGTLQQQCSGRQPCEARRAETAAVPTMRPPLSDQTRQGLG